MDVQRLAWRKSTFSGGGENDNGCVEVAPAAAGVAVRDTKDRTLAPHIYPAPAWQALLVAVRAGEL